jgi:hypothetical protein
MRIKPNNANAADPKEEMGTDHIFPRGPTSRNGEIERLEPLSGDPHRPTDRGPEALASEG